MSAGVIATNEQRTVISNARNKDASEFYTEMVALDMNVFDVANHQPSLNNKSGIYCFFDGAGNPLYVGKTNNFITRIRTHLTNNLSVVYQIQEIVKFVGVLHVEDSNSNLLSLERRVIMKVKPLFNGSPHGPLKQYGYENLRAWVDDIQQEYRRKVGSGKSLIISKSDLESKITQHEDEIGGTYKYVGKIQKHFATPSEEIIIPVDFRSVVDRTKTEKLMCVEPEPPNSTHTADARDGKTEVKRELIKQIFLNFKESEKLDNVLDAILEL